MLHPRRVIGIAGPSCSGKTTLAIRLARTVDGDARVVGLDAYYREQQGVPDEEINVDVPEAIEHELLVDHIGRLIAGESVERPVYDFVTHSRAVRGVRVAPGDTIIVEGLFTFYWPELRALLDFSVFVDADHDTCIERRVERDVRERGRTKKSVREVYEKKVRPMCDTYVHTTRQYADLILSGTDPVETLTERILAEI